MAAMLPALPLAEPASPNPPPPHAALALQARLILGAGTLAALLVAIAVAALVRSALAQKQMLNA